MINHTYNTNSSFSVVFQYLLGILLKCRDSPGLRGADLAGGPLPPLVTPRLTIGETHITHIIGRAGGVDDLQVNMPMLRATAVMVINQRLKMFQMIYLERSDPALDLSWLGTWYNGGGGGRAWVSQCGRG